MFHGLKRNITRDIAIIRYTVTAACHEPAWFGWIPSTIERSRTYISRTIKLTR